MKRADKCIYELIETRATNEKIYTLGSLIHNKTYNEELKTNGVDTIDADTLRSVLKENRYSSVKLVIRTHGITCEMSNTLQEMQSEFPALSVIDMTCPSVKRIHRIAEENTDSRTVFILFCNKSHPEAIGIMSYAKGEKYMISSPEELSRIKINKKIPRGADSTTRDFSSFINRG